MGARFAPPPGWPEPPAGWEPDEDWLPDPAWPAPPAGWQFWAWDEVQDGAPSGAASVRPAGDAPSVLWGPYGSQQAAAATALLPREAQPAVAPGATASPATARRTTASPRAASPRAGRAALLGWSGASVAALLGLASGLGGVVLLLGMYAAVVGLVAVARGRVGWAGIPSRGAGAAVSAAALVALVVGASTSSSIKSDARNGSAPARVTSAPAGAAASTPPAAVSLPSAAPKPVRAAPLNGTAPAVLASLAVKGRSARTGYDRAAFGPAWSDTDRNGCDQRNDVLRRDLTSATLQAGTHGCRVLSGLLRDPYTGSTIRFSRASGPSLVQVDHVVALGDAWVTGASSWSAAKRTAFANDPLELLSVGGSVNEAKGDGDAATWLPPARADRCSYVARQLAVKHAYGLWVTAAERAAMARVLSGCPRQALPARGVIALGGAPVASAPAAAAHVRAHRPTPRPSLSHRPSPRPSPRPTQAPAPRPSQAPTRAGVHPGAFCSPDGDLGTTVRGTPMRCTTTATDSRDRWRAA